jgi:uncharacterized protein (TIGR02145 family)
MTVIYKDVKTLVESQTLFGHGAKALVMYDASTGEATGLDVEVLINLDAEKADTTQVEALDAEKVDKTQSVIAGAGMTGGGALSGDVTLSVVTADDSLVVAADSIKVDTVDALNSTSTTKPLSAAQGKAVNDRLVLVEAGVDATAPEVDFYNRVTADSGTIRSTAFMQRVFEANKDLLSDTELLFVPEAGMKVTDGKIEKVYNLAKVNDGYQATAGSRPYVGGVIADGEKAKIKFAHRQATAEIAFSEISFISSDSFSIVIVVKPIENGTIYLSALSGIEIGEDYTYLNGEDGTMMSTSAYIKKGAYSVVEFSYTNGKGWISINGAEGSTAASPKSIKINRILSELTFGCSPEIAYIGVYRDNLSASERQHLHTFLSTEFPPIETIPVGSQQIATSNFEATVFGAVSVPEVTDNSAWEALTTPAWSHYDNSVANGAIYGKLYNGYAVAAIAPYTPSGFHIPAELEWTQLSENLVGNTVSGGKLKAKYGGFDNEFATNESGVSLLDGGYRGSNGDSANMGIKFLGHSLDLGRYLYIGQSSIESEIISASVKYGASIRLFSNTPHLTTDKYESGLFATNIQSGAAYKSIRIPYGCKVTNIKCVTSTNVTSIEAKLFNYAGTELETLITGKACNATTKSFSVTADQTVSYTDNYVRVTASGNSGVGMNIIVTIEPV